MASDSISNLQRREIQAPLVVNLIQGFIDRFGYEEAMEVAAAAIQKDALQAGERLADKYGGNTPHNLLRLIREIWAGDGALEFVLLEETDKSLNFNVTRCQYAELYEKMGIKAFGACLSCNRDDSLIKGFNSRMKLIRTQTIMQGAKVCDFRISLDEGEKDPAQE